jgi:hypothetical protein
VIVIGADGATIWHTAVPDHGPWPTTFVADTRYVNVPVVLPVTAALVFAPVYTVAHVPPPLSDSCNVYVTRPAPPGSAVQLTCHDPSALVAGHVNPAGAGGTVNWHGFPPVAHALAPEAFRARTR